MYHTVSMIFYNTERCQECQKNDYEEEEIFTVAKCLYSITLFSVLKNSEVGIYRINCYTNEIWSFFFTYILVYFRSQSWYFNKFTLAALKLQLQHWQSLSCQRCQRSWVSLQGRITTSAFARRVGIPMKTAACKANNSFLYLFLQNNIFYIIIYTKCIK